LTEFDYYSLAVAGGAHFGFTHNNLSIDGDLGSFSVVQILQTDFEGMIDTLSLTGAGGAGGTSPVEEHGKEVLGASPASFIGEALEAEFVVLGAFFFVREDFVGSADFFEFVFVSSLFSLWAKIG
jgi:hypothetical protein